MTTCRKTKITPLGQVDDFGTFKWLESIPYPRLMLSQIKAFLQPTL